MRTLAVNKYYIPIRITNQFDAISHLYTGSAVAITFEGESMLEFTWDEWYERSLLNCWPKDQNWIGATNQRVAIPRTIRFVNYGKIPKATMRLSRKAIYERDNYTCYICGKEFGLKKLSLDHVIPQSRGGKNSWDNLQTCCIKCNSNKGDSLLSELKIKPKYIHNQPTTSNMMKLKSNYNRDYPDWSYFGF